jgi:hypothetical protein
MARNEAPPIARGQTYTWYTDENGTVDATGGAHLEGKEWLFEDKDWANVQNGIAPDRTGMYVRCRLVRNKSGGALLPKRFAKYKTDGTTGAILPGQVSGYGDTVGQIGGVVDEFLPAAGAADNELFWLVIEGPSYMTTAASGDTNISLGSMVIPSTTGFVIDQDTTVAAGAATFNQIQGAIGRAMLAVNATATDVLICVRDMLN